MSFDYLARCFVREPIDLGVVSAELDEVGSVEGFYCEGHSAAILTTIGRWWEKRPSPGMALIAALREIIDRRFPGTLEDVSVLCLDVAPGWEHWER